MFDGQNMERMFNQIRMAIPLLDFAQHPFIKRGMSAALALACLFLGDSLPAGVGAAFNATAAAPCRIIARVGAGSREIAGWPVPAGAIGTVVISVGSNDDPRFPAQLAASAIARRSSVKAARAIWPLPYNRANAAVVREVAATFGDYAIDLARQPTRDQLHPRSYAAIARALASFPIQ